MADILIYNTGKLECAGIIEDGGCSLNSDGTAHSTEFIEGSFDGITATAFKFVEFIEK